jgi:hypothetical protein
MSIVSQVREALEGFFSDTAEAANRQTRAVIRHRKFTPASLAMTFILGLLRNPRASSADLAVAAAEAGADVSAQAVENRFTPRLAAFLEALFRQAARQVIASAHTLAPLLERFSSVIIMDSSGIRLPDGAQEQFPSTGGDGGQAALKLQTRLDLKSGALSVQLEAGRSTDGATSLQHVPAQPGSLRITDLGYYCIAVFAAIARENAYFLSRIQHTTTVWIDCQRQGDVVSWLNQQATPLVDRWLVIGTKDRLACRLIAWKVPPEQAGRRRQRARLDAKQRGRQPTAATLAACDWTFLITNVPAEQLTTKEIMIFYRARWQIELLFKRWKSIGLIAELSGRSDVEQMARLWARLCAALIQHWLTVMVGWNSDHCWSLVRIARRAGELVGELIAALCGAWDVDAVLERFALKIRRIARRNPRSKPGTMELLRDPDRLDYVLS